MIDTAKIDMKALNMGISLWDDDERGALPKELVALLDAAKAFKALLSENELLKNQCDAHSKDANRYLMANDRYRWALYIAKNALFKEKDMDHAYKVVCKALEVQQ